MCEVIYIKATSSHIRRHKQLREMLAELLHRLITLWLREVAMQRLCIIAILDEFISNLLRLNLRTTEDNGKDTRVIVDDTLQSKVFVFRIHHIIDMVHILCALITTAYNDFLIVVQVFLSHTLHLTTHRR